MKPLLLAALLMGGCRRPAAPPTPDAGRETIEVVPPSQIKDKVNDTLEKEHERTLDPKIE